MRAPTDADYVAYTDGGSSPSHRLSEKVHGKMKALWVCPHEIRDALCKQRRQCRRLPQERCLHCS